VPDGIPAEIVLRCPVLLIFQRKRRLIRRCSLSKAANCRLDFSVSLTVSSLPDRAETPYQQGLSPRLTIEWILLWRGNHAQARNCRPSYAALFKTLCLVALLHRRQHKENVITPDLYELEIDRLYGAMLEYSAVVTDPTRVRDPNRKGTVENAIQHTQGGRSPADALNRSKRRTNS
jgi:hypothetical protein